MGAFYNGIYRTCRVLIRVYNKSKYGFKTERLPKMKEPFLLVANHTTEDDMFFTAEASKNPMRFVCGEHLLRNKLYGNFLRKVIKPVPVPKGGSSVPAVRQLVKRLRDGESFCMFYEGKRSYHGETIPASNALGALVKKAGCALVTYRIIGGYFTYPRWARGNLRKGHAEGKVMGVYSPEQLSELSPEEITAIINKDTYENAYRTQREKMWRYKGKKLAEGMESVLFMCPCCGGDDTIEAKGDSFRCTNCDLKGVYNEFGFLEGEGLPYDNVLDWMRWIEGRFDEKAAAAEDNAPLYRTENVELYTMDSDFKNHTLCVGPLSIFKHKIEIGEHSFDYKSIPHMAVLYGNILLFTFNGEYYGLTGDGFKAWKCARFWHLEKGDTNDKAKEI